jgi:aryl carrier-like protein
VEEALASIWSELLKLERVGRHDDFFELGGHSLLGMLLIERLRRINYRLTLQTLFRSPSLKDVAASITHICAPTQSHAEELEEGVI